MESYKLLRMVSYDHESSNSIILLGIIFITKPYMHNQNTVAELIYGKQYDTFDNVNHCWDCSICVFRM